MCVPTRLYHPSRHKWRTVQEKHIFQLWIMKHILARRILTVAILCYCLCPVATGLSQRCFPGKECGIAAPLYFYSNSTRKCYVMVSWNSCGGNGFSTIEECREACEVNSTGESIAIAPTPSDNMESPMPGDNMESPTPGDNMESPTPGDNMESPTPGDNMESPTTPGGMATFPIPHPSQGSSFPLPLPDARHVTPLVSMATRDPTPSMSPDDGTTIPDLCFFPPANELCFPLENLLLRYYYKPEDNDCIGFTFFNCGGNENNFLTREECLATCGMKTRITATTTTTTTTAPTSTFVYTFQTTELSALSPSTTFPTPSSSSHMIIPMSTNVVVQMTQTNLPLPPPTSPQTHEPSGTGRVTGQSTTSDVTMTTSLTTTDMPTSTGTPSTVTISPPTTGPNSPTTGQTSMVTEAPVLSVFDYASIGVGLLALSLIVLLVGIMSMVVYRYRRRLKENAVIKQGNPTLSGPAYGHNSAKECSHLKQTHNDYYDYRCENLYTTV